MREDALRGIMAAIEEGNHGVFTEHHEEEETQLHAQNASDPEDLNNREIHPMVKHLNFDDPEFVPQDNCYAESKPATHPSQ